MKKLRQYARSHPPGTKRKSCSINRTDRYITIISEEIWAGMYFSRRGLVTHASRDDVTPEWIGINVRQALETSEYHRPPIDIPIDGEQLITMKEESTERRLAFWDDVATTYGYKSKEIAWKKKDHVFISWFYEVEPDIIMKASKSSRTGVHSAWPLSINEGRVFRVPFAASDEDVGHTVLKALARCEASGKSAQPLFP